jgi:hypothetical protein
MSIDNKNPLLGVGVVDFAGTSVVHMAGGVTSLVAAYFIGARRGRFLPDGKPNPDWKAGHSVVLVTIGTFILWTGWCVPLGPVRLLRLYDWRATCAVPPSVRCSGSGATPCRV